MSSEDKYKAIGRELIESHGVESGQMFGKACLKFKGKAFAAFFQGEMVFKLGKDNIDPLLKKYPGSQRWDPSGKGRAMKDWLQVPEDHSKDWNDLALQAMKFVP